MNDTTSFELLARQQAPARTLFFAIFALSGFSGLLYESIWTHYIKLFLGHAAYAQTLVLVIFMGGMAAGSWIASRRTARLRNLLLAYAWVEGLIGVAALAFHHLFVATTALAYDQLIPGLTHPGMIYALKWGLSAAFILPQSILLGMTFPLMSGGIIRRYPGTPGASLATLYFTNSLGAAVGVLAGGFFLVGQVGLPGTMLTAGLINVVLALVVWLLAKGQPAGGEVRVTQEAEVVTGGTSLILVAAGITGAASFLYEIAWIRGLTLVLGAATHSFELMLSAFILGLALGGLWVRKRIDGLRNPVRFLGYVQLTMGLLALATLPMLGVTFGLMQGIFTALTPSAQGYWVFHVSSHLLCLLLMLPATVCAGMTLPLLTLVLLRKGMGEKSIGAVYAANTLGAIAGVLLAVHVLMPMTGLKGVVVAGAALDMGLAVTLLITIRARLRGFEWPATALIAGLAAAVTLGAVHLDPRQLLSGVYRHGRGILPEDVKVLFNRDGKTATIGLAQWPNGDIVISTNGKADAALRMTGPGIASDQSTMVMLGALGLLMKPDAKLAANIGMGSGLTSHVMLSTPQLERLDTIEIEPFMVEAAQRFRPAVERAFTDPRSQIHFEDAKTFFSTRREQYDIIVSEPSNPWVSGVAPLFSQEFYARLRGHLKPDGVLVQWVQLYETDLPILSSIVTALSPHFEDYALYTSNDSDLLIVARKEGPLPVLNEEGLAASGLGPELQRISVKTLADVEVGRLGSRRMLELMFDAFGAPANSDYFPYVDQNAERARFLRQTARSLTALTTHALPILEMLDEGRGAPPGMPISSEHPVARGHAMRVAADLSELLMKRRYAGLRPGVKPDVLLPQMMLETCSVEGDEGIWIHALLSQAESLVPYLSQQQLEPIWKQMESQRCFQRLTPKQRDWFDLVKAVGRRDALQMASGAKHLLEKGYATGRPDWGRFAVMAGMLGYIAAGKPGHSFILWANHGSELVKMDDLDFRLLFALAGQEPKASSGPLNRSR